MTVINNILFSFGFRNLEDFLTTLHIKSMMKTMLVMSLTTGTFSYLVEKFLGLEPIAYFMIVLLFILEFLTGVSASVFVKGERFNSWKMGRMVLKIFII